MATGTAMEVGWNDGDIDDLLDRMLQQNAQDQSHTVRPSAGGELLPNIWSPPSDIDVKIEDCAQPTLQARTFTDVLAHMAGDWRGDALAGDGAWAAAPPADGAAAPALGLLAPGPAPPDAPPLQLGDRPAGAPAAASAQSPALSSGSGARSGGLLGLFDTDSPGGSCGAPPCGAPPRRGAGAGAWRPGAPPGHGADASASASPGSSLHGGNAFAGWGMGLGDLAGGGEASTRHSGGAQPWSDSRSGSGGRSSGAVKADGGEADGGPPGSAPAAWADSAAHCGSGPATSSGERHGRTLSAPDLSIGESPAPQGGSPAGKGAKGRAALARPGAKEVHAQRVQQRKTRRREKDRIEEMQAALEALGAEKARLGARNAALQAELAGDEEELRKLRAAEESALPALADEELAARFGGDITLTARGAPVTLTSAQVRAMTRDELADWWRLYVRTLAGLLELVEGAGAAAPPDALQQLQQLQREALFLHIRAAVTNANSVKHFVARGVVDASAAVPDAPSSPAGWYPISKALDLSQAQKGQLAALWASFEARVARVLAARAHLHQRICATMPNGYMGRDFAVNFLKAHEAMDALKFNLRQEHIVIYDFVSSFHQVLTPLQNARCIVRSYPYVPDSAAIATCIAARCGSRSARDRLKAERPAMALT